MTTPHRPAPGPESALNRACSTPNNLNAILRSTGAGTAADSQPWPERHHLRGREIQLSNADIGLAAERMRQNCEPHQYVSGRVMERLVMAVIALAAIVYERMRLHDG